MRPGIGSWDMVIWHSSGVSVVKEWLAGDLLNGDDQADDGGDEQNVFGEVHCSGSLWLRRMYAENSQRPVTTSHAESDMMAVMMAAVFIVRSFYVCPSVGRAR